jgi:hypothetical protein
MLTTRLLLAVVKECLKLKSSHKNATIKHKDSDKHKIYVKTGLVLKFKHRKGRIAIRLGEYHSLATSMSQLVTLPTRNPTVPGSNPG